MNSTPFKANLTRLCFITSLEKFTFHGIRFLLVLSMTKMFALDGTTTCLIYGGFMALTFCTPLLSGWMIDNFLSNRLVSLWGGLLAILGCLLLTFNSLALFYLGLGFIIVSGGMLRATIPVLLSNLYRTKEDLKDSGFTLWYIACNLGACLAALVCGYVGEKIGWHYSFYLAAAAAGSLTALLYFSRSLFPPKDLIPSAVGLSAKLCGAISFMGMALLASICLKEQHLIQWMFPLTTLSMLSLVIVIYYKFKDHRWAIVKFIHLLLLHMLFMALYEQGASSFVLFIDALVNKTITTSFGQFDIPTTFFQAIDPAAGMVLGLSLTYLWFKLAHKNPSEYIKFAFGFLMTGIGFFLITLLAKTYPFGKIPSFWMVLVFLFMVLGELFIIPIGMSYASSIKVGNLKNTLTGLWLLSVASGQWFATLIAGTIHTTAGRGIAHSSVNNAHQYYKVYGYCFKAALVLGGMAIILYLLKKIPALTGRHKSAAIPKSMAAKQNNASGA